MIHIVTGYFLNRAVQEKLQVIKHEDVEGVIKFMNWYMHSDDGSIKDEQFLELINVGRAISRSGSRTARFGPLISST